MPMRGRLHQPGHPASPFAKGRKLNPAGAVFHAGLAPHPFDAIQNLGEREHADNDRDKVDTAVQGENIEREAIRRKTATCPHRRAAARARPWPAP